MSHFESPLVYPKGIDRWKWVIIVVFFACTNTFAPESVDKEQERAPYGNWKRHLNFKVVNEEAVSVELVFLQGRYRERMGTWPVTPGYQTIKVSVPKTSGTVWVRG